MRTSASESDRVLGLLLATQLGVVSTQQVEAAGFDRHLLYRRADAGLLVPVFRNVFRSVQIPGDVRQGHVAAGLAVPGSTVSGRSAAVLHGFPLPRSLQNSFEAFVLGSQDRQCEIDGIAIARTKYPLPATRRFGVSVLSSPSTIVSIASQLGSDSLERALDHGLLERLFSVNTVKAIVDGRPANATRGRAVLCELLDQRTDGSAHRSKTEQRSGRWLRSGGLTTWRKNFKVAIDGEDDDIEVDFGWEHIRTCLEVSPFATHATLRKQERDARRRTLLTRMHWRIVEATDRHLSSERQFAPIIAELRGLGAT
jgi:Transcriptional regulator, AbiEi antitoxin